MDKLFHTSVFRRRTLRTLTGALLTATLALGITPTGVSAASSWSPTLLVNTEAFQQIDVGNGTSDIELRFGASTKTIKFLYTKQVFQFSHSISVLGTISGSSLNVDRNATVGGSLTVTGAIISKGTISGANLIVSGASSFSGTALFKTNLTVKNIISGSTLRISGGGADIQGLLSASGAIRSATGIYISVKNPAADAILSFGNTSGAQTLKFLNVKQVFQFSKGISVLGTISGSSLNVDRNATVGGTLTVTGAITGVSSITAKTSLSGNTLTVSNSAKIGGTLSASGTVALEGHLTGATIAGFGLKSCNSANQSLQWNSATNKFECTTISTTVGNGSGELLSLHPTYPNAVYFGSGTTTIGQLSASGNIISGVQENYYHWQSTQAGIQDYWISVRVRLPNNFSSWDPVRPIQIRYRTSDTTAGNNHVTVRMRDTAGAIRPLTGAAGLTSATFTTLDISGPEAGGTFDAKGYITLYIKLAAKTGGFADVGLLNLNFETTTP